ncbi:Phosphatidylinositol N-acetylglucosaminyltransferase subunit P [Grifola frondosa]|uniref:Phosphatidylinositol N-acetylglucosaminyltransferase subunit P n=1 Tax=Grifola frondosa TaxID=5627 RepID=A0A1C7LSM7_GRIFR|nr:Phosphatidylinositol N-acetylglucosaminyltransferase subunit P [Grifola frondosa]
MKTFDLSEVNSFEFLGIPHKCELAATMDADMAEKNPTSPITPLAPYPPLLPTESRSRAAEFYGFVAWTSTYLLFCLFLVWAFLPDEYIIALGVSWYPSREWALLLPAYGMVVILLTYFTYFALTFAGTPSLSDMSTITDSKAHLPDADAPNPYLAHAQPNAIPEMYDIPLGMVNRVVYGDRRRTARIHNRGPQIVLFDNERSRRLLSDRV